MIIIENQTDHCVKLTTVKELRNIAYMGGYYKKVENVYWLDRNMSLELDLGLSERYKAFKISYCAYIEPEIIEALNEGRSKYIPKKISKTAEFIMPNERYITLLYEAAHLPTLTITDDAARQRPIINFPKDIETLKKAIEKEKEKNGEQK